MLNVDYERIGAVVELFLAQRGNAPECLGYEVGAPSLMKSYCWHHYVSVMGETSLRAVQSWGWTCIVTRIAIPALWFLRFYDADNQ